MRRLLVCLVALLAIAATATACGTLEPYALIVNGTKIPQHDVDNELKAIRANGRYLDAIDPTRKQILGSGSGTFNADFAAFVLNQDLDYELVHLELTRRKLSVAPPDLDQAKTVVIQQVNGQDTYNAFPKWYQDKLQERFAEVIVLNRALTPQIDDAQAMAYYNAHQDQFVQACASHILVDTPQAAADVEARLAKGEDFATLAKSLSTDTTSGQKGGDVGCFFHDAQLVQPFLDAAFSQPVGQPGQPVQSQFGFHIIKVTSRAVAPYSDPATKQEVQSLMGQGGGQQLQQWLTGALQQAKVKMNPKFGTYDKSKSPPQITAPQAPPGAPTTTSPDLPTPGG
ncbi:MAG: peptidylprolyl isomerase [Acidimicrobiia bacterium]|nr:peptidylprolyl isomerase [Acidimicrobiia bacterium]